MEVLAARFCLTLLGRVARNNGELQHTLGHAGILKETGGKGTARSLEKGPIKPRRERGNRIVKIVDDYRGIFALRAQLVTYSQQF
jgi:hypothetical protein